MKKICLLVVLWLVLYSAQAQVFPVVIENSDQGSQTLGTLGIYNSPNNPGLSSQISRFDIKWRLVANSPLATGTPYKGSDGSSTSTYWQVDLPGTVSAVIGYVPAGSTLSNPDCVSEYIHITNSSIPISVSSGGTTLVTISGTAAKVFSGQNFAVKSKAIKNNITYYEIYLPNNCSEKTGWVNGAGGNVLPGSTYALSTPALNPPTAYNGTSVKLSWDMAIQPSGLVNTSFEIWRGSNTAVTTFYKTVTGGSYTDQNLNASNSYTYQIIAKYNSCSSQISNARSVGTQTGGGCTTANVTANFSPANPVIGGTLILSSQPMQAGTYTYSWSGPNNFTSTSQNPPPLNNFSSTMAGTYTVTLTKSGCTSSFYSVVVPSPGGPNTCNLNVSITGNASVNCGQPIVLTANASTGGVTYAWFGPNGFTSSNSTITIPNSNNNTAGEYSVTVSKNGCTNGSNKQQVSVIGCVIPRIKIDDNNSQIPRWQRFGENYSGKIIASTAPSNLSWHIEAFSGTQLIYKSAPTTGNFIDFNSTNFIQQAPFGYSVNYKAVLDVNSASSSAIQITPIIRKKWDNENIVLLNEVGQGIKIPMKYIDGATRFEIGFARVERTAISKQNLQPFNNTGCLLGKDFCGAYLNSQGYIQIPVGNDNNLNTIEPGVFEITLAYFDNNFKQVGATEVTQFDLTKIGKITYPNRNGFGSNANRAMILIGGIKNETEKQVQNINGFQSCTNCDDPSFMNSKVDMSIISFFNSYGFDTWYIAQPNLNGVTQNAYDIGIAIQRIKYLHPQLTEFNIICHSKGGLEIKALLGSNSSNSKMLTRALNGDSFSYSDSTSIYDKVKKVAFLATPHKGSILAFLSDYSPEWGCPISVGCNDLIWNGFPGQSNSIINILQKTAMPVNTSFLNLTAFGPSINSGFAALTIISDGAVLIESSVAFNPNNGKSKVQLFQNYSNHFNIHKNYFLSHEGECTDANHRNLNYIYDFFNGSFNQVCSPDILAFYSLETIKSILSNSKVQYKSVGDTSYKELGNTDENGKLNFGLFNSFSTGDSLKIIAPGVDTVQFPVNISYNNIHKLVVALFASTKPTKSVQYPSLALLNQNPITGNSTIQLKVTGKNVDHYLINQHNHDTTFTPLVLSNNIATVKLDTGYNNIVVKYIGTLKDTAILSKEVYYLPGNLINTLARDFKVNNPGNGPAKMFVNNIFYQDITKTTNVKLLNEVGDVKFTRYGYRDTVFSLDTVTSVNLQMQPYSYSSTTDSSTYDFNNKLNPQYWKSISLKNISAISNIQVSAKQYNDPFDGTGLKPQTRKFVFRNLTGNADVKLRTAIALDQADTPNLDSVYLLSITNGEYTKYEANKTNLSQYDPEVQKLAFDAISLKAFAKQEIVLMKKQAAIALHPQLQIEECQLQRFPLNMFVSDPDNLKGDLAVTTSDPGIEIADNFVTISRPFGKPGLFSFKLSLTHDFITAEQTYSVDVVPCPINPFNTFTPNGDGINDTWVIENLNKFTRCQVSIFDRSGGMIFHSVGYGKAWDGTYGGKPLTTGTYYYIIDPKEPGYKIISGNVTIIK